MNIYRILARSLTLGVLTCFTGSLLAANSAVILVYHRFGETQYPTTSVTMQQFAGQLEYLQKNHYHVLPLEEIVNKIKQGEPLPEHTVAITLDDAFRTAYTNAWPLLQKYHYPFTVFVATQGVDHHYPAMMTWDMLRDLAQHGVSIQNHSTLHDHLPELSTQYMQDDFEHADHVITQEIGKKPIYYAYPYGEYTPAMQAVIKAHGYQAAFGQYSGVVDAESDWYGIPRFGINAHYGELSRFESVIDSLPLDIEWVTRPPEVANSSMTFPVEFKLTNENIQASMVHCFLASGEKLPIDIINPKEIQLQISHLPPGHDKINCTARDTIGWRWVGMPIWVSNKPVNDHLTFAQAVRAP